MSVVVLNAGSSSLKFGVYGESDASDPPMLLRGQIAGIGNQVRVSAYGPEAAPITSATPPTADAFFDAALDWVLEQLHAHPAAASPTAIGHRVVHGGREFAAPAIVTDEVLAQLDTLTPLAPQHQPYNLTGVRRAAERWPEARQVACFDTAFHRTQTRLAQLFALPRALSDAGVQRYGFHGLSYEYIAETLPRVLGDRANGRVIVAHLGHGASLCAMKNRRSIATTMGFTALDGLMMATRCGTLDPGVVLHLVQQEGRSIGEVEHLLYAESGLLGVSGLSSDMKTLLDTHTNEAREAVDLFVHSIVGAIGELAARLEGLDALIFTAGVGEHAAPIRAAVAKGCAWLGAQMDAEANDAHRNRIDGPESAMALCVIPTDEEIMIARHAAQRT